MLLLLDGCVSVADVRASSVCCSLGAPCIRSFQLHKHWIHMLTPDSGQSDKVRIFSPISLRRLIFLSTFSSYGSKPCVFSGEPLPRRPSEFHSQLPDSLEQTNQNCCVCLETRLGTAPFLFSGFASARWKHGGGSGDPSFLPPGVCAAVIPEISPDKACWLPATTSAGPDCQSAYLRLSFGRANQAHLSK